MEHYYVVVYDDITDEFLVDVRARLAKFGERVLYNGHDWFELDEGSEPIYAEVENTLVERLRGGDK